MKANHLLPRYDYDFFKVTELCAATDEEFLSILDEILILMSYPRCPLASALGEAVYQRCGVIEDKLHEILSPDYPALYIKKAVLDLIFYRNIAEFDCKKFVYDLLRIAHYPTETEKLFDVNLRAETIMQIYQKEHLVLFPRKFLGR